MPLINLKSVNEAVIHLQRGDLVIYPTETAYALGADATNAKAIRKIFKIKQRSKNKPLPFIVASLSMAERYVYFSKDLKILAKHHWPGPLTLVAPIKKSQLSGSLNYQGRTAALRVSSNALAKKLSQLLGRPIAATSANISGQGNIYNVSAIRKKFANATDKIYFLSGGTLPRRKPSTIVALKNGKLIVLRHGAVSPKP